MSNPPRQFAKWRQGICYSRHPIADLNKNGAKDLSNPPRQLLNGAKKIASPTD